MATSLAGSPGTLASIESARLGMGPKDAGQEGRPRCAAALSCSGQDRASPSGPLRGQSQRVGSQTAQTEGMQQVAARSCPAAETQSQYALDSRSSGQALKGTFGMGSMNCNRLRCGYVMAVLSIALCGERLLQAQTARRIAQTAFPSVVLLVVQDAQGQPISLGSGFFVRPDIIATNLHVIEGGAAAWVRTVGQKTSHTVTGIVALDQSRDLVLLSVSGLTAPPLQVGDSNRVQGGRSSVCCRKPTGVGRHTLRRNRQCNKARRCRRSFADKRANLARKQWGTCAGRFG